MVSWLTSKLLNYILGGSVIAMAIALGTVTISKNATIHELRSAITKVTVERDQARSDLVQCRANEHTLEASISDQNREVDRMRLEGETRQHILDSLREDLEAKTRVANILSRKGSTAEDADKLILELTR